MVEQIKEEPKCEVKPNCDFATICCPTYHRVCDARVECCENCIDKPVCPMVPYIRGEKKI